MQSDTTNSFDPCPECKGRGTLPLAGGDQTVLVHQMGSMVPQKLKSVRVACEHCGGKGTVALYTVEPTIEWQVERARAGLERIRETVAALDE